MKNINIVTTKPRKNQDNIRERGHHRRKDPDPAIQCKFDLAKTFILKEAKK